MNKHPQANQTGPRLILPLAKHSLGPFVLGSTLFSTLDFLRTSAGRQSYPWVHIKYDTKAVSTTPILVVLLPSIHLVFTSPEQVLCQIHILSLPLPTLSLTYHPSSSTQSDPISLCTPDRPLTFGTTSAVFGPTFNGSPSETNGAKSPCSTSGRGEGEVKEVWYPGLGFRGKEPGEGEEDIEGKGWREERVRSIHLCEREDWRIGLSTFEDSDSERVWKRLKLKTKKDRVELEKVTIDAHNRSAILSFLPLTIGPLQIKLNETTSTDLLVELGPPLRSFWKEDSRLRIHYLGDSEQSEDEDGFDGQGCYFWNYLQYGIDFLLSPSHMVIKMIFHSNLPGSVTFGRFERCPWNFSSSDSSVLDVTRSAAVLLETMSSSLESRDPEHHGTTAEDSHTFFGKETLGLGMELDRAGEGWGQGVLLEASTLVAASSYIVFEVLESGFVESVIMS
ncbi:Uncharacterized conserved protein [Phaffia rhodozyma]|uniref:Uncharacterized conserved protein n=1 Tax=Phaffia rhodozyma TaxID=264483 RepID=A0A0F7SPK7_PHARH|nr:Uncharacterized conserved protein [Phaffia rhodozyma]